MAEIIPERIEFQDTPLVGGTTAPRRRKRVFMTVTAASIGDTVDLRSHPEFSTFESFYPPFIGGSVFGTTGTANVNISGTTILLGKSQEYVLDLVVRLV